MEIIACIKRVPETAEADLVIDKTGRDIEKDGLVFDLNEWDSYAVEEAVLLKDRYGGTVTAISMGPEEANEILRRALGMGADRAIRLTDPGFEGSDGYAIAKILSKAIEPLSYDVILTGVQTEDDGYGQVGPAIAQILGIRHAAVVSRIEDIENGRARVHRELEGGLEEVLEIDLPAVLTIQTGINEPRYVSIMGIRKAAQREIEVLDLQGLDMDPDQAGEEGSLTVVERASFPPVGEEAQMLEGTMDEISDKIIAILREKGGVA